MAIHLFVIFSHTFGNYDAAQLIPVIEPARYGGDFRSVLREAESLLVQSVVTEKPRAPASSCSR
eukprot:1198380-Pleurochrysis_carterae.AAC.1